MFRYDQPFTGISSLTAAPAQKAGNISQIASRVRGREAQILSYSYDYLSRLSSSTFHNYSDAGVISGTNNYNENLSYDLRGNIQTLQRTGFYTNGSTCTYGQIDNLTYSYTANTNRLHKVLDGTLTAGDAKSRGFNGLLSTVDNSMTYDRNGNLNKNLHKNVSTITYNHLNLPTVITFTTGNTIEFLYDAAGTKLRKTVKVGATVQYIQDYLPGGIEYRQTGTGVKRVESVFHAEGRYYNTNVDVSSTISWRKEYNFKDHLGNTRLVFTDRNANGIVDITGTASTSDVLQENHYYAFGLAFEGAWLQNDATARDNKYQYNGKELNDDFGLNWNDYGARWYDASVGRWNAVEPYASKMPQVTGYAYVKNNPITRLDPNGMWDIIVHAYHDRTKNPYGMAVLYDRHGNEVHRFRVRLEGVAGRDRTITNGDTPLDVYDIPSKDMWLASTENNRKSYGPNRRLVLNAHAGEIKESNRTLIRVHGGRQERKIKEGAWEAIDNPQLKRTEGCFRAFDADMAKLYELTQELMAKDSKEDGGFLLLTPDLMKVPAPAAVNGTEEYMGDGFYAIPGEGHDLRMQGIGRVINGDMYKLLKELQQEQAAEAKKKEKK